MFPTLSAHIYDLAFLKRFLSKVGYVWQYPGKIVGDAVVWNFTSVIFLSSDIRFISSELSLSAM